MESNRMLLELERFDPKAFCRHYSLTREELSRLVACSPRTIDLWNAGGKISKKAHSQINRLVRLLDSLEAHMEADYIGEWLRTPNPGFNGSSPLQVIERGEEDRISRMLYRLETGQPM